MILISNFLQPMRHAAFSPNLGKVSYPEYYDRTRDLPHHHIEGKAVGIVHILISGQSPDYRNNPSSRSTMFLLRRLSREATAARVHHQWPSVRTDLRPSEQHPHMPNETCPLKARTLK